MSEDPRPPVWVGHVGIKAADIEKSNDYWVTIGMRPIVTGDGFAVLELRGGTFNERHFRGDSVPDFNVYRQRVELTSDVRRWAPWIQQDLFFDHERGFFRTRTRIGENWNLRNNKQISFAYQFQYTQNRAGEWTPQHTIVFRYWFGARASARGR